MCWDKILLIAGDGDIVCMPHMVADAVGAARVCSGRCWTKMS